jgi:hypothetical protein
MELRRFLISSIFILLNFRIPSLYSRSSITYSEQLSGIIILGTLCWSRKILASLAATLTTDLKNGSVRVIIGTCGFGGGNLERSLGIQEKARRVLQAATVEAYGRAGMYVIMDQLMSRANLSDPEEFRTIAQYLELTRPPQPLESSMPGIFAVGDVRHGSVKRVASAVGEGSIAIQMVHDYLTKLKLGTPS